MSEKQRSAFHDYPLQLTYNPFSLLHLIEARPLQYRKATVWNSLKFMVKRCIRYIYLLSLQSKILFVVVRNWLIFIICPVKNLPPCPCRKKKKKFPVFCFKKFSNNNIKMKSMNWNYIFYYNSILAIKITTKWEEDLEQKMGSFYPLDASRKLHIHQNKQFCLYCLSSC